MKKMAALGLVFLLAGIALAGGIKGIVTEARTNEPIVGAVVTAYGPNGRAGTGESRRDGSYEIAGLAAGTYRVQAMARGYEDQIYPRGVEVPRVGDVKGMDFSLRSTGGRQPGGISGQVLVARRGTPVPGAVVTAKHGRFETTVETNERGAYFFRGLEPGRYKVHAQARGFEPAVYPEPVVVLPGEVTEHITFELVPRAEDGAIGGFVFEGRTREPIQGARVVAKCGREYKEAMT
ncbi:MAG: carboxypeptidase-like regulatory domain-containing protein, partial [candidate division WOR-3 bacterium]